jgi:hypothetical protein
MDARALAAVLTDPGHCGYLASQVDLLCDASTRRTDICRALDNLAARTTEQDTVLLFYSGHGYYDEKGAYYLTSYDTQFTERGKITIGTAISQQELLTKLRALSAKRVLTIFNACHAGEISLTLDPTDESFTGNPPPEQTTAALLATGEGRIIISACRENQYSFIGNGEMTIFGQALVNGLRGESMSSQQEYISAFDLYTYVYQAVSQAISTQVPEAVRRRYGEKQQPELTVLKGVGPFAVALRRGAMTSHEFHSENRPIVAPEIREVSQKISQAALEEIHQGNIMSAAVRHINISSGRYLEGGSDKRQGAFVNGGTIYGPVVGNNEGTIKTRYGSPQSTNSVHTSLERALDLFRQASVIAQQQGDVDLADDLDHVGWLIEAAQKARNEGKPERHAAKLTEFQETLRRIVANRPDLPDTLMQFVEQR